MGGGGGGGGGGETVTFEIQCQYSSSLGRSKADQHKVCELQ